MAMADSEFERFKKMFPGGKKDMKIMAIPSPLPGPGGIVRGVVGRGVQSGVRRFSEVGKGDKTTKMKTRQGTERRDPMEPRVVESGRSEALRKAREGGGGVTKMKDRRGLEIKKPESKREVPPSRGDGRKVAKAVGATGAIVGGYYGAKEMAKRREARAGAGQDKVESTQSVQRSSFKQTNPTQRAYDSSTSPGKKPVARPQARPADLKTGRKAQDKSKTRIAFEKKFAKERASGKKVFVFKGKKYNTKLAK